MIVFFVVDLFQIEVDYLLECIQVEVVGYYWVVFEMVGEELEVWCDVEFGVGKVFVVWVVGFGDFCNLVQYEYWWQW